MKLFFILSGDKSKASSRVRGFWMTEELMNLGHSCTLSWGNKKSDLFKQFITALSFDGIVFQKTYSRYHRAMAYLFRKAGKQVFLDIDDAPSRINSRTTLNNFRGIARISSGILAGSTNLVKYCSPYNINTQLIPSSIRLASYSVGNSTKNDAESTVCVGWIGNGRHYQEDLIQILAPALKYVSSREPLKFKLVGACGVSRLHDVFSSIAGLSVSMVDHIEWSDSQVISDNIDEFDIGLYPLLPNEFNTYKCGFKALEYMAKGIPVISSPVAANKDIIEHNLNGLFADSELEWGNAILSLVRDAKERSRLGLNGMRHVQKLYSTKSVVKKLEKVLMHKHS